MIDGEFRNQNREDLLKIKERVLGPIIADSGVDLSEEEYLKLEIQEAKEKRRSYSLPLIGCGLMVTFFSFANATPLTQFFAILLGLGSLILGIIIVIRQTKVIQGLHLRLEKLPKP